MPLIAAASAISGIGSLASGLFGASASRHAANQQAAMEQQAIDLQRQQFQQTQQNLAPFMGAGTNAVNSLQTLLGLGPQGMGGAGAALASTPGYQFQLGQGLQALQAANSARGVGGGNAMKALMQYGQGLASGTYQNQVGNLANLAGLGESAAANTGSFGAGSANAISQLLGGIGNANAAGTIGSANAIGGGLTGLGQSGLNYAFLTQLLNNPNASAALNSNNINLVNNPALGSFTGLNPVTGNLPNPG